MQPQLFDMQTSHLNCCLIIFLRVLYISCETLLQKAAAVLSIPILIFLCHGSQSSFFQNEPSAKYYPVKTQISTTQEYWILTSIAQQRYQTHPFFNLHESWNASVLKQKVLMFCSTSTYSPTYLYGKGQCKFFTLEASALKTARG